MCTRTIPAVEANSLAATFQQIAATLRCIQASAVRGLSVCEHVLRSHGYECLANATHSLHERVSDHRFDPIRWIPDTDRIIDAVLQIADSRYDADDPEIIELRCSLIDELDKITDGVFPTCILSRTGRRIRVYVETLWIDGYGDHDDTRPERITFAEVVGHWLDGETICVEGSIRHVTPAAPISPSAPDAPLHVALHYAIIFKFLREFGSFRLRDGA